MLSIHIYLFIYYFSIYILIGKLSQFSGVFTFQKLKIFCFAKCDILFPLMGFVPHLKLKHSKNIYNLRGLYFNYNHGASVGHYSVVKNVLHI